MKKIILLITLLLILVGCSNVNQIEENKLNIVTSFYPVYVATANIVDGVEDITLENLTSTEVGCLHDYQLTTANLMLLERSDVLIINGGGMESFIQKAIDNCKDLAIINSSEGILEEHEKEHEHHQEGHNHGQNSHIWVSISLYKKQIENICNELIRLDEKNAEKYRMNTDQYLAKLDVLKNEMHETLKDVENINIVTFHEAFDFFAEEFGLNIVAIIEREPGTYPSAGDLAETICIVKSTKAKAVFVEPQYAKTAANTIARETGIEVYSLDPVVSGELDKDAYEKIMRENMKTLKEALED